MNDESSEGILKDAPAPTEQVLRPNDVGFVNVDRLSESIAREMGYSGTAFGLEVVNIQNWIFSRAQLEEFRLYREDKPFPFIVDALYEMHGGLRLTDADASKVRVKFLGSQSVQRKSERQDANCAASTSGDNWKMRVQAQAAARILRLRSVGANPTVHSILDDMAKWCREKDVKTNGGIFPSSGYLRTHVLGGKHWTPPH